MPLRKAAIYLSQNRTRSLFVSPRVSKTVMIIVLMIDCNDYSIDDDVVAVYKDIWTLI